MSHKTILNREEVLHLAGLAKLHLSEDEIEKFRVQLGETIDYVKVLDELDIRNVSPTHSIVDLQNIIREDGESSDNALTAEETFQNAKSVKENEFVVDRIMD